MPMENTVRYLTHNFAIAIIQMLQVTLGIDRKPMINGVISKSEIRQETHKIWECKEQQVIRKAMKLLEIQPGPKFKNSFHTFGICLRGSKQLKEKSL